MPVSFKSVKTTSSRTDRQINTDLEETREHDEQMPRGSGLDPRIEKGHGK
jgi:hypothetical protein